MRFVFGRGRVSTGWLVRTGGVPPANAAPGVGPAAAQLVGPLPKLLLTFRCKLMPTPSPPGGQGAESLYLIRSTRIYAASFVAVSGGRGFFNSIDSLSFCSWPDHGPNTGTLVGTPIRCRKPA